ncbi:MAG: hypothetical protein AAGA54_03100 [Myxococcota bacterium]
MLRSLAVALALSLAACSTDDDASKEAAPDASTPQPDAIAVACAPASKLDSKVRDDLNAAALEVFGTLRKGDIDAVWDSLHPQAQRDDQRDAFKEALESMHRRLRSGGEKTALAHSYVVDVQGGVTALTRVQCGEENDPQRLALLTNAGNENVAVVTLLSGGDPFGFATTVQLRRHKGAWKVLGVHVGLATYRGSDASDYESLADAYVSQRRVVEAYLVLGIADKLAQRGGSVRLHRGLDIAEKLDAVTNSREFQQALGVWEVGGRRYDVQGFSITATQSDLSFVVEYVTPTGLIKEALESEADALVGYVNMQYPELAKRFDAVVFEAYDSESAATKGEVQAFRTPRVFDGDDAEFAG